MRGFSSLDSGQRGRPRREGQRRRQEAKPFASAALRSVKGPSRREKLSQRPRAPHRPESRSIVRPRCTSECGLTRTTVGVHFIHAHSHSSRLAGSDAGPGASPWGWACLTSGPCSSPPSSSGSATGGTRTRCSDAMPTRLLLFACCCLVAHALAASEDRQRLRMAGRRVVQEALTGG